MQNTELATAVEEKKVKGVLYLKSRKDDDQIRGLVIGIVQAAWDLGVDVVDISVDRTEDFDLDRMELDELYSWMESQTVQVVVVKSIFDISRNAEDINAFLRRADAKGVAVMSYCGDMSLAYVGFGEKEE